MPVPVGNGNNGAKPPAPPRPTFSPPALCCSRAITLRRASSRCVARRVYRQRDKRMRRGAVSIRSMRGGVRTQGGSQSKRAQLSLGRCAAILSLLPRHAHQTHKPPFLFTHTNHKHSSCVRKKNSPRCCCCSCCGWLAGCCSSLVAHPYVRLNPAALPWLSLYCWWSCFIIVAAAAAVTAAAAYPFTPGTGSGSTVVVVCAGGACIDREVSTP